MDQHICFPDLQNFSELKLNKVALENREGSNPFTSVHFAQLYVVVSRLQAE